MQTAALEDLEEVEQPELSYEEERGKPMPSNNHGIIQARLIVEFSKHREFDVISELSLKLGERPVTPDISIYPRQPLDLLNDVLQRTDPPLLVVEIFSPTQATHAVLEKVGFYFAGGVKSVWLVAPPFHLLTVFAPDRQQQTHLSGVVRDPVIGVTADLDAVFS